MNVILIALVLGVVGFISGRLLVPVVSPRPDNLGVTGGKLADCPDSPNCVHTQQDTMASKAMIPLNYTGSMADAKARLIDLLNSMDNVTIIDQSKPDYVYAEFRTAVMQFIDDVEFYIDDSAKVIHFRSASRIGNGDAGKNHSRMSDIQERWQQAPESVELQK